MKRNKKKQRRKARKAGEKRDARSTTVPLFASTQAFASVLVKAQRLQPKPLSARPFMPSRFLKRSHVAHSLAKEGLQVGEELFLRAVNASNAAFSQGVAILRLSIPVVHYKTMLFAVASAGLLLIFLDAIFVRARASKVVRLFENELELLRKRV